jgi:hypothetical protein
MFCHPRPPVRTHAAYTHKHTNPRAFARSPCIVHPARLERKLPAVLGHDLLERLDLAREVVACPRRAA